MTNLAYLRTSAWLLLGLVVGCSSSSTAHTDGGSAADSGRPDSATGHDGGTHADAKVTPDSGARDAGAPDSGTPVDSSTRDTGSQDAGSKDGGPKDAVSGDTGEVDAAMDAGALLDSSLGDSGMVFNCMGSFDCPMVNTTCLVWTCVGSPGVCQESYAAAGTTCSDHGGTTCDGHGVCE